MEFAGRKCRWGKGTAKIFSEILKQGLDKRMFLWYTGAQETIVPMMWEQMHEGGHIRKEQKAWVFAVAAAKTFWKENFVIGYWSGTFVGTVWSVVP